MTQLHSELTVLAAAGLVDGVVGRTYVNRAYGVAFTIPTRWTLQDSKDVANSQSGNILAFEGLDPDAFAAYTRSMPLHTPFVTIADMEGARFVPEATSPEVDHLAALAFIAYEGNWRDDGPQGDEPLSLSWWAERDLGYFKSGYHDFRLIQELRSEVVSECEAVGYAAEYSLVHADLPFEVPVRERALYIHQDPAILGLRMVDYPMIDPPILFDYSPFVRGVVIL